MNGPIFSEPWFLVAAALLLAAWVAMMVGVIFLVFKALTRNAGGGWATMAARFGAPAAEAEAEAEGAVSTRETVQVGSVVYKRCATVGLGPAGLSLKVPLRAPVLVPWSEIHSARETTLHWQPALTVEVGRPTAAVVTFKAPLAGSVAARLRASAAATPATAGAA